MPKKQTNSWFSFPFGGAFSLLLYPFKLTFSWFLWSLYLPKSAFSWFLWGTTTTPRTLPPAQLTEAENEQLRGQVGTITEEKNELTGQLTEKNDEVTRLNRQIDRIIEEKNGLTRQLTEKNDEVVRLNGQIDAFARKKSELTGQLTEKSGKVIQLNTENEGRKTTIQNKNSKIARLEKENKGLIATNAANEQKLKTVKEKNKFLQEKTEKLKKEKKEFRRQLTDTTSTTPLSPSDRPINLTHINITTRTNTIHPPQTRDIPKKTTSSTAEKDKEYRERLKKHGFSEKRLNLIGTLSRYVRKNKSLYLTKNATSSLTADNHSDTIQLLKIIKQALDITLTAEQESDQILSGKLSNINTKIRKKTWHETGNTAATEIQQAIKSLSQSKQDSPVQIAISKLENNSAAVQNLFIILCKSAKFGYFFPLPDDALSKKHSQGTA